MLAILLQNHAAHAVLVCERVSQVTMMDIEDLIIQIHYSNSEWTPSPRFFGVEYPTLEWSEVSDRVRQSQTESDIGVRQKLIFLNFTEIDAQIGLRET